MLGRVKSSTCQGGNDRRKNGVRPASCSILVLAVGLTAISVTQLRLGVRFTEAALINHDKITSGLPADSFLQGSGSLRLSRRHPRSSQPSAGGAENLQSSGGATSGPRRVLQEADVTGKGRLGDGTFGKGGLGVGAEVVPYGPRGINDPNDPPEGKVFRDEEVDSDDYLEESRKWSKVAENFGVLSSAEQSSAHCLSYYQPQLAMESTEVKSKVNVKFEGEFGYELMVVLPFAYFHFLNGTLGTTISCGDESTSMFYWFSPRHRHDSKCVRDDYKNKLRPYGWRRGLHKSPIPPTWFPPPFASHFREWGKVWSDVPAGAPLVVIANKISNEWAKGPINFIDLVALKRVIKMFIDAGYYVVYNRAGNAIPEDEWQKAGTENIKFDDYKVIRKLYLKESYKGRVMLLQDIHAANPGISFNEAQVRMMARSKCFVSVQGGNSILSSYFGGTNIIYAKKGFEIDFRAYQRSYHQLSGTHILLARSYYRLDKHAANVIRRKMCGAI